MVAVCTSSSTRTARDGDIVELKDRLRELRQANEMTLRQLRERIEERTGAKMSFSYLSALERGEATPSIDILTRIAAAYDMTVDDLLAQVSMPNAADPQYSASLNEFARRRKLDDSWKRVLWRIEYRGKRPDTVRDWELLYAAIRSAMELDEEE